MQAKFVSEGRAVDLTPDQNYAAGAVVPLGQLVGVAPRPLVSGELGAIAVEGVCDVVKDASTFAAGEIVYWADSGNPVGGTAGSGQATATAVGSRHLGVALAAAATAATTVRVRLLQTVVEPVPITTVAATGSTQADAASFAATGGVCVVTAADATKGVKLPSASGGAKVTVRNNANAVLKVYPATGDALNALAANAALSMAAYTSATFVAIDATTWFTNPLLPS